MKPKVDDWYPDGDDWFVAMTQVAIMLYLYAKESDGATKEEILKVIGEKSPEKVANQCIEWINQIKLQNQKGETK